MQREANLPVRIRVRATADTVEKVHAEIGGGRINCASVELFCDQGDKMRILSKVSRLGAQVEDVDVAAPSLDEVYRYFSKIGADDVLRGSL